MFPKATTETRSNHSATKGFKKDQDHIPETPPIVNTVFHDRNNPASPIRPGIFQTQSSAEKSYGSSPSTSKSAYKPNLVGTEFKKGYRNLLKREKSRAQKKSDPAIISETTPLFEMSERSVSTLPHKNLKQPKEAIDSNSEFNVVCDLLFGSYINILLAFVPIAFVANFNSWSDQAVFWINFFAMIPLACILGDLTDEVALHTNQTIGGLINATFGNAVEVVVAIQALKRDEFRIVQASMIGSIYSNLLLVLGCSFLFGGLKYREQSFNHMVSTANMGLLCLSTIAFVLPTPFSDYAAEDEKALLMSRTVAIALILMYLQLLFFQLKSHRDFFDDKKDEEEEEDMKPDLSLPSALVCLTLITVLIAKLSDFLVGSVDGFCLTSGMTRSFVGLIIIPVIGNAVEHLTAVRSAMNDKMDLAMGVAVGSSTQISLFVAPLTVIIGWKMDKPMTLNFPQYEIVLYVLSVLVVAICTSNAKSNWLEGSILITTYVLVAVGFWYEDTVE